MWTEPRRKRAKVLLTALLVGLTSYTWIYFWQPRPLLSWIASRESEVVFSVETDARIVALTLDDGPHPTVTPRILDALAENGCRATFFFIGNRIPGNERILTRVREEGHELANHLETGRPAVLLRTSEFENQLLVTEQRLGVEENEGLKWYRPAFGWYTRGMQSMLARHGYRLALGSVYPHDTKLRSVPLIVKYILARTFPGSVIVLHDGQGDRKRTAEVLEIVLPELRARGYEVVTLSELVERGVGR